MYNIVSLILFFQSRVIRVLNLWQKNEVFTADIIQPLFDLANSGSELHRQVEEQVKRGGDKAGGIVAPKAGSIQVVNQNSGNSGGNQMNSSSGVSDMVDDECSQVMSTIQAFLANQMPKGNNSEVKFNKKLLDFDYSDDEDAGDYSEPTPQMVDALSNILNNERILTKLKVRTLTYISFLYDAEIFFYEKYISF